jgi:hypothetical protein
MQNTTFVNNLKTFNRKERFYLVGAALGNQEFNLCIEFVRKLRGVLGCDNIDYLSCNFVAMDYHLDWIYASLFLAAEKISSEEAVFQNLIWTRDDEKLLVKATQEDIDLIVVFADKEVEGRNHLVLIEAKGVGSWDTRQLNSKGRRLEAIFGNEHILDTANVIPHFVYAAPKPPSQQQLIDLPHLMATGGDPLHLELILPKFLVKITQCDSSGKALAQGTNWKLCPENSI